MQQGALIRPPPRRTPGVARAIAAWRELTGGRSVRDDARRTLIACSGGADSSALILALAAASAHLVVAHVLHDMRPAREARADRDAAAELARDLGLPFAEARIRVRARPGNLEANARIARYRALASLARRHNCPFVATAHHADDQLETLLMRLVRGAGARGLAGVAPRLPLGRDVVLVRPLLGLTRAETEGICAASHWDFQRDATNSDASRLRSALRLDVIPRLKAVAPAAALRASSAAASLADLHHFAERAGTEALGLPEKPAAPEHGFSWSRSELRTLHPALLAAGLRRAVLLLTRGRASDRLGSRAVRAAVRAVLDTQTDPRTLCLAAASLRVTARTVGLRVEPSQLRETR